MGQALYRKYRSKSLDEIVGQEHIITALKTALKEGRLSHAYLFTGPRGVGKTSIARILAHQINELPYTEEDNHLDIIEIDAASNRGIDEIRDLREKVHISPTTGKYKVYIIDEVHMLTPQAFNALLKTLEEPPAHVVFILATTEVHKLPATIISRTQRYTFRPAEIGPLTQHLKDIATNEKMSISDEALELIAEHGDGSFRDSVGLLDQIGHSRSKVTTEDVQELLGVPPKDAVTKIISFVAAGNMQATAETLQILLARGFQAATIAKQLGYELRANLLAGTPPFDPAFLLALCKELIAVPASADPARFLEIILLDAVRPSAARMPIAPLVPIDSTRPAQVDKVTPKPKTSTSAKPTNEPAPVKNEEPTPEPPKTSKKHTPSSGVIDMSLWPEVLKELKTDYNTLYSIVRMAEPQFEPGKISLTFSFAFHQRRLNEVKNKTILSNIIEKVSGNQVEIVCLFDKNVKPNPLGISDNTASSPAVDTISSIFGGGEVLDA